MPLPIEVPASIRTQGRHELIEIDKSPGANGFFIYRLGVSSFPPGVSLDMTIEELVPGRGWRTVIGPDHIEPPAPAVIEQERGFAADSPARETRLVVQVNGGACVIAASGEAVER